MAGPGDSARPERVKTDADLAFEREKTDDELTAREDSVMQETDRAVEQSRQRSDEALSEARRREDHDGSLAADRHATHKREDATIAEDRAVADAWRSEEREDHRDVIREFLYLEREATDLSLLTERVQMDAAVVARDDFMGMASHDLRTLLGGITLQATLLRRHASSDGGQEAALRAADRIERLAARMNRLIGDLVDVASIEAGKLSLHPEQDDVARIVRDTLEAFQPTASAHGVALSGEVAAGSLVAKFDHGRILQVLANLVGNALAFTPEGGRIVVGARPDGEFVRFSVSDTGSGVPAGQEEAIFERFSQAPQASRRGLGLGLYISRCIIEAHGGRIWLAQSSSSGSTFCFTLPAADTATR